MLTGNTDERNSKLSNTREPHRQNEKKSRYFINWMNYTPQPQYYVIADQSILCSRLWMIIAEFKKQ